MKTAVTFLVAFVAYDGEAAVLMTKSFDDPAVVRFPSHFACVFVAPQYDLAKFQSSYVPWIGATPETKYKPPVLIFGTAKGGPRADLRVDNLGLEVSELTAQLEKVLAALEKFKGKEPEKFKDPLQKARDLPKDLAALQTRRSLPRFRPSRPNHPHKKAPSALRSPHDGRSLGGSLQP